MSTAWITNASTNVESMVNPINAACESGFVPEHLYVVTNDAVEATVEEALDDVTRIVTAYDGEKPAVHLTALDDERDFDAIRTAIRCAIEEAQDRGDEVGVDITPGRKFMSSIAFAAGMRYDADHVFYLYVASNEYFGKRYPELPRSATHLYDFTEVA